MGVLDKLFGGSGAGPSATPGGDDVPGRYRSILEQAKADRSRAETEYTRAKTARDAIKNDERRDEIKYQNLRSEMSRYQATMRRLGESELKNIEANINRLQGHYQSVGQLSAAVGRLERFGSDVSKKGGGGGGYQRQLMMSAAAQGVNVLGATSTLDKLPVLGGAIHSGVGTAANALAMGAGGMTAGLLGGAAFLGIGAVGAIHQGYQTFEQEEALRRRMGQMGGLGAGDATIAAMRRMGLTRDEIGGLGIPLAHATGDFGGLQNVYKTQTAYGLGANAIGLMGAAAGTGAEGEQSRLVRDAISAGMVSGLKQGRFHEMVDGVNSIVKGSAYGVTVNAQSMAGTLGYMGQLGAASGLRGGQLTGLMGAFDAGIRSQSGFAGSLSFITGYQHLQQHGLGGLGPSGSAGAISPFDVMELGERGVTGKGGMGAEGISRRLAMLKSMAGVGAADFALSSGQGAGTREEIETSKRRIDAFKFLLKESTPGLTFTGARKVAEGFLTEGEGKLAPEKLQELLDKNSLTQEKAFEDIREQTGLQQRIAFGIEALGRSMPGAESGRFNKIFEGMLTGLSGEAALAYQTPAERLAAGMGALPEGFGLKAGTRLYTQAPTPAEDAEGVYLHQLGGAVTGDSQVTGSEFLALRQAKQAQGEAFTNMQEVLKTFSASSSDALRLAAESASLYINNPAKAYELYTKSGSLESVMASGLLDDLPTELADPNAPGGKRPVSQESRELGAKGAVQLLELLAALSTDPRFTQRTLNVRGMSSGDPLQALSDVINVPLSTPAQAAAR